MKTKQTIAVIGATGNQGSAIAKSLSTGNYRLLLCANEQEKVQALAQQIRTTTVSADVEVIECSTLASWEADIIITAVPFHAEKEVAGKIKEVANQKIVISIADPLLEADDGIVTGLEESAAEALQKMLPNSKVVKSFNTIYASDFTKPFMEGKQIDAFIAGNDKETLQTVSALMASVYLNPIVAGDLSISRTLENMQLFTYPIRNKAQLQLLSRLKHTA